MDGKYTFWGMIIAALITGGITFYLDYNSKKVEEEKEKERLAKIEEEKKSSFSKLNINEILLPSINTELDSFFYLKISNDSYNDATNVNLKINFGETQITECEVQPKTNRKVILDSSLLTYSLDSIKKDDSFFVYCTLKSPIFDSILISGENLKDNIKLTFNDFKTKKTNNIIEKEDELGFFTILFRIWFVIMGGYFTIISITMISRKLSL